MPCGAIGWDAAIILIGELRVSTALPAHARPRHARAADGVPLPGPRAVPGAAAGQVRPSRVSCAFCSLAVSFIDEVIKCW